MEDLSEYMPKSVNVTVGKEKLTVNEFTVAKRDAIVKVLLSNLDAVKMVGPFMEAIRKNRRAGAELLAEASRVSADMKRDGKTDEEIRDALMKVAEKHREKTAKDDEFDVGTVIGQAKELALKLLSNDLTLVSCLALDSPENCAKVELKDAEVIVDKEHGYEHSPQMFDWVRGHLTLSQEHQVLNAVVEVNDIIGLVKNYWTPVAKLFAETKTDEAGERPEMKKSE